MSPKLATHLQKVEIPSLRLHGRLHDHESQPASPNVRRLLRGGIDFSKMARRVIGSGDAAMETSAHGFGCMGMTAWYGEPISNDEAVALLKR